MLYLELSFFLSLEIDRDIKVPPELVNPCIIPITQRIDFLKKFILNLILPFDKTNKIERNITKETKSLKLINS